MRLPFRLAGLYPYEGRLPVIPLPPPIPTAGQSHHISLEDLGQSKKYGFMIVPNSARKQRVNEVAPTSSLGSEKKYATGAWETWVQQDWVGGIGQDDWNDNTRFVGSVGINTRVPNELRLDGRWRETLFVVAGANSYIDFYVGTTDYDATVAAGEYTTSGLCTAMKTAMEAQGSGLTFTVTFGSGKFTIAGSATFTIKWLNGTNTATSLGRTIGYDMTANDGPGTSFLADYYSEASATVVKYVDFGDDCYALCSTSGVNQIRRWIVASAYWKAVTLVGAAPTDGLEFGSNLIVMLGDSTLATYTANGTTWANCTAIMGTYCVQWRSKFVYSKDNAVYEVSTPATDAVPTASGTCGSAAFDITALAVFGDDLYIGKPDGLWRYDGTTMIQVLDRTRETYSGNFKWMTEYQGFLYFNVMRYIYKMSDSGATTTLVDVTPSMPHIADGAAGTATLYGYGIPQSFTVCGNHLYVAFDDGGNDGQSTYVMAYNGRGWHQLYYYRAAGSTMNCCFYSPEADMLWFNGTEGSIGMRMLTISDRPAADHETTGYIFLSVHRGAFPMEQKAYNVFWADTLGCTSTNHIQIYKETTEGTLADAWTLVGTISTSPYAELRFVPLIPSSAGPTVNYGRSISRKQLRLKLVFVRDSTVSSTPRLFRFGVRFQDRVAPVHAFRVTVRITDNMPLMPGYGIDTHPASELLSFLDNLEKNTTGITYTDPDGYPHYVFLNSISETIPYKRVDGVIDRAWQLLMMETELVAIRPTQPTW